MRLRNPTASLDTIPRRLIAALFLLFVAGFVGTLAVQQASAKYSATATNTSNTYAASSCFQPWAVSVTNTTFGANASTSIKVGCSVKWTFVSGTHTTTSTSPYVGLWNSGNMSSPQTFTYLFNATGTYPYRCSIHAGMTGTITVTS
jgi:plastocyanin